MKTARSYVSCCCHGFLRRKAQTLGVEETQFLPGHFHLHHLSRPKFAIQVDGCFLIADDSNGFGLPDDSNGFGLPDDSNGFGLAPMSLPNGFLPIPIGGKFFSISPSLEFIISNSFFFF